MFEDLGPWLGRISIVVRDPEAAGYRYKLFGSTLAHQAGRDLTGETMAVWGEAAARGMTRQFDSVIGLGVSMISHFTAMTLDSPYDVRKEPRLFEKVLVPVSYAGGAADAVFCYSAPAGPHLGFSDRARTQCDCDPSTAERCPHLTAAGT